MYSVDPHSQIQLVQVLYFVLCIVDLTRVVRIRFTEYIWEYAICSVESTTITVILLRGFGHYGVYSVVVYRDLVTPAYSTARDN